MARLTAILTVAIALAGPAAGKVKFSLQTGRVQQQAGRADHVGNISSNSSTGRMFLANVLVSRTAHARTRTSTNKTLAWVMVALNLDGSQACPFTP